MLDTSRFQEAVKYASYMTTPLGRLRSELAWENLRRWLPHHAANRLALDVGGGTGYASMRLARLGFEVVLLEGSEEMLEIAQREAEAGGAAARISFHHADLAQLPELFADDSFDIVVCHNVLEYLEEPSTAIRHISALLRNDGTVSVLVRNRAGEVLKAAIHAGDCALAKANISAETVMGSLLGEPLRLFTPADLHDMLTRAGLEVIEEHGVRVFSDYIDNEATTRESYDQVFELELMLGSRPEFAAIARYTQLIARRCKGSSREEAGQ